MHTCTYVRMRVCTPCERDHTLHASREVVAELKHDDAEGPPIMHVHAFAYAFMCVYTYFLHVHVFGHVRVFCGHVQVCPASFGKVNLPDGMFIRTV